MISLLKFIADHEISRGLMKTPSEGVGLQKQQLRGIETDMQYDSCTLGVGRGRQGLKFESKPVITKTQQNMEEHNRIQNCYNILSTMPSFQPQIIRHKIKDTKCVPILGEKAVNETLSPSGSRCRLQSSNYAICMCMLLNI